MKPPKTFRRRFIRLTGGGIISAAVLGGTGCSNPFDVPGSALTAWQGPADDLDIRRWALSWAILAPNPHNRQPWLVTLDSSDTMSVRIDPTRLLPQTDPFARQILIGTGAFLELLTIAASHRGYRLKTRLFPRSYATGQNYRLDDDPVVRIRFIRDAAVSADPLFRFALARHTERGSYDAEHAVPVAYEQRLQASLKDLPVSAGIVNRKGEQEQLWKRLASIAQAAWAMEMRTPKALMESMTLLRVGRSEIDANRDGIVITDPVLVMLDRLGIFDRSELPDPGGSVVKDQIRQFNKHLTTSPAFIWLRTENNTRPTQLASGAAFLRAQLLATSHAMVMHPLSQALQEYAQMQPLYQEIHQTLYDDPPRDRQTIQMFCRLGFAADPANVSGPSPRRGLPAHLEVPGLVERTTRALSQGRSV